MTRGSNQYAPGSVTGGVTGLSRYHDAPIAHSDPSGLFDSITSAVGSAAAAAQKAAADAAAAAQKAAADAAAAAQRAAREKARQAAEAAAAAKRAVEEKARQVAEAAAAAQRAAQEKARQAAEAAQRAAQEKARQVAEAAAAAQRAAQESAAAAKRAAEEKARQVAAAAQRAAEEKARQVVEAAQQADAARRAAEEKARQVANQAIQAVEAAQRAAQDQVSSGGISREISDHAGVLSDVAQGVSQAAVQAAGGGVVGVVGSVVGTGVSAADAMARAAVMEAERLAVQVGLDRQAAEIAARLAEEESKITRSVFGVVDYAQDVYQDALEFSEASASDKIKGVGDYIANAPGNVVGGVAAEIYGLSEMASGNVVDESEKQRLKDLTQAYVADSIYNIYATPGQVVDLATAVIDIGDEVFGSGDYERTHFADDIKKGIFKRDQISSDVPGSQLGYGTQYDRDVLKKEAFSQWSDYVGETHGPAAGAVASLAGGITTSWHDMPLVESVMWMGGVNALNFVGKAGPALAATFATEQVVGALGDAASALFGGDERSSQVQYVEDGTGNFGPMNTFMATQADEAGGVSTRAFVEIPQEEDYSWILAEQQALEAAYLSEMERNAQYIADYQQMLDDEYFRAQAEAQAEYEKVISEYQQGTEEYNEAVDEYNTRLSEIEDQYLVDQEAYQQQVNDYQQQINDEYDAAIAEYQQQVQDAMAHVGGSSSGVYSGERVVYTEGEERIIYVGDGGEYYGTDLTTGTVTGTVETVSQPAGGINPLLIVGGAGAVLLAGAYALSSSGKGKRRATAP